LRGLDRLLTDVTGLPVIIAEDPLSTIAEGTGRALDELELLCKVGNSGSQRAPYYYPQYASAT
jgi:rod shape-determining protein MreB